MKLVIASLALLALTGCQERYRYPCQDPANWGAPECQKPQCSANGTCPEDLSHYEKDNKTNVNTTPAKVAEKGECK